VFQLSVDIYYKFKVKFKFSIKFLAVSDW